MINNIQNFIDRHGVSAGWLAETLGVKPRTLYNWIKKERYPELTRRALNDLEREMESELFADARPGRKGKTKLAQLRREKGMTLRTLAEKVGKSHQCVSQQERKGIKRIKIAKNYASPLGVDPERLVEEGNHLSKFAKVVGAGADISLCANKLGISYAKTWRLMTSGVKKFREAKWIAKILECSPGDILE